MIAPLVLLTHFLLLVEGSVRMGILQNDTSQSNTENQRHSVKLTGGAPHRMCMANYAHFNGMSDTEKDLTAPMAEGTKIGSGKRVGGSKHKPRRVHIEMHRSSGEFYIYVFKNDATKPISLYTRADNKITATFDPTEVVVTNTELGEKQYKLTATAVKVLEPEKTDCKVGKTCTISIKTSDDKVLSDCLSYLKNGYLLKPYYVLNTMFRALENELSITEGIFRRPGIVTNYNAVIEKARAGTLSEEDSEVKTKAGALKQFVRSEIPTIIPDFKYQEFAQTAREQMKGANDKEVALSLYEQLPTYNKLMLLTLVKWLKLVVDGVDVTKMAWSNLAICFGPTIMQCPYTGTDAIKCVQDAPLVNKITEALFQSLKSKATLVSMKVLEDDMF